MAKLPIPIVKYMINASFEVDGIVEKPDVIGAIFGQTEGLVGDLELRELQKSGRIGRIEVEMEEKEGKCVGSIKIPTSLSKEETSLIAAALETIERIGPCSARIRIGRIEDVRESKRSYVIKRAKELLHSIGIPSTRSLVEEIASKPEMISYGEEALPAGPRIEESEEIVVVEGRADVINLLKCGIENAIAIGGVRIPRSVKELAERKITTLFVDGDRVGELIIKEALSSMKVDYIARAPQRREVEELEREELLRCLSARVPVKRVWEEEGKVMEEVKKYVGEIEEKELALIFDEKLNLLGKVPLNDLGKVLKETKGAYVVAIGKELSEEVAKEVEMAGIAWLVAKKSGVQAKVRCLWY